MTRFLLAGSAALALGACSFSPSADVIKALAGDPNSICFTVVTIYGQGMFDRNHGCPNNQAAAGPVVIIPGNMPMQVLRP